MESVFDFFRKIHTLENRFYEKYMTQEKGLLTEYDYFMLSITARNAEMNKWIPLSRTHISRIDALLHSQAIWLSEILSDIQVAWDYSPELVRRWLIFYKKHPMVRMLQERLIRCLLSR